MQPEELDTLLEKLHYLSQGAELVVFAGSLPRDVDDGFYAEAIHDLARRQVPAALACEGEPLRLGVEAEPLLVSPSQREAEALVGQEFHDDEDFELGLARIAELGARNVIVTTEQGCVALLREGREAVRLRASAPRIEPVSAVAAEDVLLAAYLGARSAGRGRHRCRLDARARRGPLRPAPGGTSAERRRSVGAASGARARSLTSRCMLVCAYEAHHDHFA